MKYTNGESCCTHPEEDLAAVNDVLFDAIERAGGLPKVRIVPIDDPDKSLGKD